MNAVHLLLTYPGYLVAMLQFLIFYVMRFLLITEDVSHVGTRLISALHYSLLQNTIPLRFGIAVTIDISSRGKQSVGIEAYWYRTPKALHGNEIYPIPSPAITRR